MTRTWDDVLDDFEDLVDEVNEALDEGRAPETAADVAPEVPGTPMEARHAARFADLRRSADEAAQRLREAMAANVGARAQDRDRLEARRRYGGQSRRVAT